MPVSEINAAMNTDMPIGCGCQACMDPSSSYAFADIGTGESTEGATSGTATEALDLQSGSSWGAGDGSSITLTYKFHTAYQSYWGATPAGSYNTTGMEEFSTAQKNAVNAILNQIESFTNITFNQVSGSTNPDIGFINAEAANVNLGGTAYYPTGWDGAGDVFVNENFWAYDGTAVQGSVNYFVLLHEIGHALGLQHSFEAGLAGNQNTEKYTVMAYDTSTWGNSVFAQSHQLYDIAALQDLYGTNNSYNSGNTNYVLESGNAYTIWDGSGVDTLDASGESSAVTINLKDGAFSSVGLVDNIAIAYGAIIENAEGGSGNDVLIGNDSDNTLSGNAGDDTLHSSLGNDTLDGGAGTDTAVYASAITDFIINIINATTVTVVNLLQSSATDLLRNIENFVFNGSSYTLIDLQNYIDATVQPLVDIAFGWVGDPGYVHKSENTETLTLTAETMNHGSANGNLVSIVRDANGIDTSFIGGATVNINTLIIYDDALDVTFDAFGNVIVELGGTDASNITLTDIHSGRTVTGSGDDVIQVTLRDNTDLGFGEYDNFLVRSGNGDDTIDIDGTHNATKLTVYGGVGNDNITVSGVNSDDKLYGEDGDDIIYGGDGLDKLYGGTGADRLYGDAGNDTIYGQNDDDMLYGGDGNDILKGDAGYDELYGEAGNDVLFSGAGGGRLDGGAGTDKLFGDSGVDTYVLTSAEDSVDGIYRFSRSQDLIDISDVLTGFTAGVSDIDDFVRLIHVGKQFNIEIDSNGGADAFTQIAAVYTNISNNVTAQNLYDEGVFIV